MDATWVGEDAIASLFLVFGITLGVACVPLYTAVRAILFPTKFSDRELDELQRHVEQIGQMTETQRMGVIIASGVHLKILRLSGSMEEMLGIDGSDPHRPSFVGDLLPPSFRGSHARMLSRAFAKGALPDHLMHPLKNVDLQLPGGKIRKTNVSIGVLTGRSHILHAAVFYAVVSPASKRTPFRRSSSTVVEMRNKPGKRRNYIELFALHMYGRQISENLTSGTVPQTENHFNSGVMFIKWCCPAEAGGSRLTTVHVEIERLLTKYSIRRIQSWGDCYLVVTGTHFVAEDAADSTVQRLAAFSVEVMERLRLRGTLTELYFGVHTGPVSIAFVPSANGALSMTVFGDTVNTAARMQQSGVDGMLHLTEEAATQLQAQRSSSVGRGQDTDFVVDAMEIKSKGMMRTVWFDCAVNAFAHSPRAREAALGTPAEDRNSHKLQQLLHTRPRKRALERRRSFTTDDMPMVF